MCLRACVRACCTLSNRDARRLDDELRAVEQSMKSLNSSAMQVPQAKKEPSEFLPLVMPLTLCLALLYSSRSSFYGAFILPVRLFPASNMTEIVQELLTCIWDKAQPKCRDRTYHILNSFWTSLCEPHFWSVKALLRYWGFPFHLNICNSYFFSSLSLSLPFWIFLYFLLCLSVLTSVSTSLPHFLSYSLRQPFHPLS